MHDNDAVRDQLIRDIEEAFTNVERGNGTTFHEAVALDDYRLEDLESARLSDADKHWRDVPDTEIETSGCLLGACMDVAGTRFHLPMYMIWSLRHYKRLGPCWFQIDHPIYNLCRLGREFREGESQQSDYFDEQQCRVICRYLEYMRDRGEGYSDDVAASEALDGYWRGTAKTSELQLIATGMNQAFPNVT